VIEPDYRQRGAHDYRKDACLTMQEFEQIVLHCIKYYNSQRIIENYPYTNEMLKRKIEPYANKIFSFGCEQNSTNFIDISLEKVMLTLLPRVEGKFSRKGLVVNNMRYVAEGFTEEYLKGGTVIVAYNPDDVNTVYFFDKGEYQEFVLVETRYRDKTIADIQEMQKKQKEIVQLEVKRNLQARIDLANHIQTIASLVSQSHATSIKGIRENRQKERQRMHEDFLKEGVVNA